MKAIVGTALLGLAFGAQDDELWSLFPKAEPTTTEPLPIIENNQNSGNNAVKLTPPASYTGRSYLFKKADVLTLDDDNDELWSLFPRAEPPAPPTTDDTPVIDRNRNDGNKAIKVTPPASYTGGSYLFKKADVLTLDDDNEFFSQPKVADSHRESRFFGNLGRFVSKSLQPRENVRRPAQVQIQVADDELMNLNALLNDALQTYNDARQSKPNVGQLVNDGIQIIRDIKKHDDEDNELFELAQIIKEAQSAQKEVKKVPTKAKNFLRQAKQAKRTVEDTLCFEIHGVRHCLAHPEN